MDGSITGNEQTVAGATASDQRALVLIDALGARLVEAIKAGVDATTEGLGVIAGETERLDQRLGTLADLLERQPAPVEATVDLTPIVEMLAELRDVVSSPPAAPPADLDVATRDHVQAEGTALAARLDDLELSVRTDLSDLADRVAAIIGAVETARPVDLSPVLAELATREGDSGLDAAVAVTLERMEDHLAGLRAAVEARPEPDLRPVVSGALDEVRSIVDERIAALAAALPGQPDLAPVVHAVSNRLAELRGSLQGRIDEIQACVAAGPDLSPVTSGLEAAVGTLTARLDRIEAAIADRADEIGRAIAVGTELAEVRHDAVAAGLASIENELRARVATADVLDAVGAIRGAVDMLAERLDTATGQSRDDVHSVQEAVLRAVDALAADVASVRERAVAAADSSARARQDIEETLAALGEQTASRIDGLHDIFSHGTDLTPFLESVAGIGQQVADVRAAIEHHAPGAAILELLRTLGDLRGTMTAGHDHLAAELTAARSSVENWLAQLDGTVSHVAGTQAEDMAGLVELSEQVRDLQTAAAERSADAAQRLASIEAGLAGAEERYAEDSGRLVAIHEATSTTAEHASAIAGWAEAQQTEQWLAGVERSVNDKLAEIVRAVPSVHDAVEQMEATVRRAGDATAASLDGLRSHLASAGGFTGQVERFRALQTAVDGLAVELARSNTTDLGPAVAASIDQATARAVGRLEEAASSAVTRFSRRDEEILRRTADLEANVVRSIETIESEVREVIAGLSGSDRLVRSRFAEVETTLQGLRGEVAHVRMLRSAIDALTGSLDVLRHQARLTAAVPGGATITAITPTNGAAVAAAD